MSPQIRPAVAVGSGAREAAVAAPLADGHRQGAQRQDQGDPAEVQRGRQAEQPQQQQQHDRAAQQQFRQERQAVAEVAAAVIWIDVRQHEGSRDLGCEPASVSFA